MGGYKEVDILMNVDIKNNTNPQMTQTLLMPIINKTDWNIQPILSFWPGTLVISSSNIDRFSYCIF